MALFTRLRRRVLGQSAAATAPRPASEEATAKGSALPAPPTTSDSANLLGVLGLVRSLIKSPYDIPINTLLHSPGPGLTVDEAIAYRQGVGASSGGSTDAQRNLAAISDWDFAKASERYGPEGVFALIYLACTTRGGTFDRLFELISTSWALPRRGSATLHNDNALLPECSDLGRFAANLLQPPVSRKLYRPGRRDGCLAIGIGGPRILVSLPFKGMHTDLYDSLGNSIDVVTSLNLLGYQGTFLFLDYSRALNRELAGLPEWLVIFSKIATQSDLVLFVTEGAADLAGSQLRESQYTPDRIHKKIVRLDEGELQWATKFDEVEHPWPSKADSVVFSADLAGSHMTESDYAERLSSHIDFVQAQDGPLPAQLLEDYVSGFVPNDQLLCVDEDGTVTVYPPDFPSYGSTATPPR
jgi:hypothetical protein